jgi:hypothetical protein
MPSMTSSAQSPALDLPSALTTFAQGGHGPLNRLLLQVVLYPKTLTVGDFDWLLAFYQSVCPPDRITRFKIAELMDWSDLDDPVMTLSAREAAAAGRRWPHFEAARNRIREGRALEAQLWDGREMAAGGTFNLHIRALKYRDTGLHWFVRFLFPLDFPTNGLIHVLRTLTDRIDHHSGHGGLMISFSPDYKDAAFTEIYSKVRRFWGVDLDILDLTADRMHQALQPPCWLNAIGHDFAVKAGLTTRLHRLQQVKDVAVFDQRYGSVFVLGQIPSPLDRNRLPAELVMYQAMQQAIEGHVLQGIGPFAGEGFNANETATEDWLGRFSPDAAWAQFRGIN